MSGCCHTCCYDIGTLTLDKRSSQLWTERSNQHCNKSGDAVSPLCPHHRLSALCSATAHGYCDIACYYNNTNAGIWLSGAACYSSVLHVVTVHCRLLCYPGVTRQHAVCPAWPRVQHSWGRPQRLKHCKALGRYTCTQTPQLSVQPQKLQIAAPKLGTHRMPEQARFAAAAAAPLLLCPLPCLQERCLCLPALEESCEEDVCRSHGTGVLPCRVCGRCGCWTSR